jgi:hypothetical protein
MAATGFTSTAFAMPAAQSAKPTATQQNSLRNKRNPQIKT